MERQVKVCRDCKYMKPNNFYTIPAYRLKYSQCTHPKSITIDIISGEELYKETNDMRKTECETEGILFEREPNRFVNTYKVYGNHYVFCMILVLIVCVMCIKS